MGHTVYPENVTFRRLLKENKCRTSKKQGYIEYWVPIFLRKQI